MNEQSFNPQENAPHSPNTPQDDASYQHHQGGFNPQGNPSAAGGQTAGEQSQHSYNTGPQQPPPDPKKMAEDQFANELKQAWAEYERVAASADAMGQRGDVKPEVIEKIKQTAKVKLDRKIAEATERFAAKTAGQCHAHSAYSSRPHPATKLYRSESDKMIAGVCGGLAEYFGIDSTWVRILFIALPCLGLLPGIFFAVVAYIAFSVILPVKTSTGEFRRMF